MSARPAHRTEDRPEHRFDRTHTDDLMRYIAASPSPYHAVANAAERLAALGFRRLTETDRWEGGPGGRYVVRGGALIAWFVPEGVTDATGFRIVGGHTDSPNLRVKPRPDTGRVGWRQVAVELYGGTLLNTWLDRDLGLSGRLALKGGGEQLVLVDRPLMRVPQLAIHLDRAVNEGMTLDKQHHMQPVWGLGPVVEGELIEFVAKEAGVAPGDVAGWDLMVHDVQPPAYLGRDRELVAAPRLDNLVSVHAGLAALAAAAADGGTAHIPVLAAFDHEEVGSASTTGAGGPLLENTLRRIIGSEGWDDQARAFADTLCLSSDVGHAVHPNYAERHDPDHHPLPNGGPILKVNANQRYATDASGRAAWTEACERAGVPWQTFVSRNSIPCGSTIGPITATRLGVETVDVGIAMLSMHSAREMCGAADPYLLASAMHAFLTS